MENDNVVVGNIKSINKNGNILINSGSIFSEAFYFQDYYDDALIKKFIKNTERLVRQSHEYNQYLAMIKENYNILNYDNILSHINSDDAEIEIHHYPFSLYDIVDILMNYHLFNKDNFTSFSIAQEVMNLHFAQKIGFVPLSKTNHELAHAGQLFISTKQIFGNWEEFATKFASGMSEEQRAKVEESKKMTEQHAASDFKNLYTKQEPTQDGEQ